MWRTAECLIGLPRTFTDGAACGAGREVTDVADADETAVLGRVSASG
jgi:hypothetical protein